MQSYEKLGVFYLGRPHDLTSQTSAPEPLLYDSKDLLTHAMCVGMTGSGKTGLCLSLLEEQKVSFPENSFSKGGQHILLAISDL